MQEIYLVDGSCFIYRAYYAIRHLSTLKGIPTNAIYGFTRMLLKLLRDRKVQYMLIAFDSPHPTKRHRIYEEYKITRPETPEDLPLQIGYIKEIVDCCGISRSEIAGYEADDIIATLASNLEKESALGNLFVNIVTLDKDMYQLISDRIKIYDPFNDLTVDKDYILKKFGITPDMLTDFMALVGDNIDNVPGVKGIGEKTASELLRRYGSIENILKNLEILKPARVAKLIKENIDFLGLSKKLVQLDKNAPIEIKIEELKIKGIDKDKIVKIFNELEFHSLLKDILQEDKEEVEIQSSPITQNKEEFLKQIEKKGFFGVQIEKDLIWLGVDNLVLSLPLKEPLVKNLMESNLTKIFHNAKESMKILKREDIKISTPYFDTMIAAYLLNPNKGKYHLSDLALEYFGNLYTNQSSQSDLLLMIEIYQKLCRDIKQMELEDVYFKIELPIVEVITEMEEAGIRINVSKLEALNKLITSEIGKLKSQIYSIAGFEFNINSPKQLAEVLYDKLGLKTRKRGKKARSTEMDVLEELRSQHELPEHIINYRGLNKLLTSYLIPLRNYINLHTGRIHATWSQTVAGTGRIVSSDPNLQNIPVKGHWSQYLREVFIPEDGCVFLSADYSQIELRILAHLSEDKNLIQAFKKGKDIHTATASELFSVSEEEVTDEQRRVAKTVNFGISYGISPFGLSESIKIPYEKAEEIIEIYFLRYPGIRTFIEKAKAFAREKGYVRTLFGRIRPIPEIMSSNLFLRSQAERMAVNAVVQGTAADIIKMAMVKIHKKLKEEGLSSRIILQIHDEIVLEIDKKELEKVKEIVSYEMKDFPLKVPLEVNIYTGESLNL